MRLSILVGVLLVQLVALAYGSGFSGKFVNIPTKIDELFKQRNVKVLNGDNYQSKFRVDLYPLNNTDNEDFSSLSSPVYKDYTFDFNDLASGEYELIISSYDFFFENDRYRILVNDNNDIVAVKDELSSTSLNKTSGVVVSNSKPLEIQFKKVKQFYEHSGGTISEMLLSSPLGFIFKNQTYTLIFIVAIGVMIAPTVLSYINPELAEQFNPSTLAAQQDARLKQAEQVRKFQEQSQQSQQQQPSVKSQPIPNKAPQDNSVRKRR